VIKDYRFLELQLVISYFSGLSIDFHPKEVIEFTAVLVIYVSPGNVFPAHLSLGMSISPHTYP